MTTTNDRRTRPVGESLIDLFLANLTSPPLLFFFLGAAAAFVRSDLDIPTPIAKFLSLYLLLAIGYKGGVALAESQMDSVVVGTLSAAILLSALVPLYVFWLMKRRVGAADAAAIAACYGSVSAVTFVAATTYLDANGIEWGGHLVAAMALMESPAIVAGIFLFQRYRSDGGNGVQWRELLRESCFNGSVFLIVGAMIVGFVTGPTGMAQMSPFVIDLFIGMLCLFLLDMGIVAARRLRDLRASDDRRDIKWIVGPALVLPAVNAVIAGAIALQLGLTEGDALLLTVLAASASYIAVPAAMRLALPEANPGTYLSMSLGITFPLNLLVGIPVYHAALRWVAGA